MAIRNPIQPSGAVWWCRRLDPVVLREIDVRRPGEDVSQRNTGYAVFGGVEVAVWKWFIVGGEAQHRGVPHAIGKGSVSQDFGETNLGGFAVRLLFGVKH